MPQDKQPALLNRGTILHVTLFCDTSLLCRENHTNMTGHFLHGTEFQKFALSNLYAQIDEYAQKVNITVYKFIMFTNIRILVLSSI